MDRTACSARAKTAGIPTIIFLHIGKTGGSTLRKIMHRNFERSEILLVRSEAPRDSVRPRREASIEDLATIPRACLSRARLIQGHMIFGSHEFVPGPSTYITLLRKPVGLAISQYRFVLRTPGHRLHEVVTTERMTLEDYIRSGVSLEVDNSQTRAISGDVGTPFGAVTGDMLEQAKKNIEGHFSVVGLTERFDETVMVLHNVFGWTRLTYTRVKVGPKSQEEPVSQATIQGLTELNRYDSELYAFASGRLDETIRRYPSFKRELSHFKRMNSLYRPWGVISYTLPKHALAVVKR